MLRCLIAFRTLCILGCMVSAWSQNLPSTKDSLLPAGLHQSQEIQKSENHHAIMPPELPGVPLPLGEALKAQATQGTAQVDIPSPSGWKAPHPLIQMSEDPTLLGVGGGGIFVPTMTESRLEPEFTLRSTQGGSSVRGKTSVRVAAEPGDYILEMGMIGQDKPKIRIPIQVNVGKTTLVPIQWSGLLIETLDAEGEYIAESYEIIDLKTNNSLGRGYGQTDERLQNLRPWILPPGLYRIQKTGSALGGTKDFITVQLNAGELTTVEAVFENLGGDLISGGVRPEGTTSLRQRFWRHNLSLGGTLGWEKKELVDGNEKELFTVLGDARWRSRLDHPKWFSQNEARIRTTLRKEDQGRLIATTDDVLARMLWVRRVTPWIGPYARLRFNTHFVETLLPIDEGDTLTLMESTGERLLIGPDTLRTRPPLNPILLAEGLGISVDLLRFASAELSVQGGVAARQLWQDSVWVPNDVNSTKWKLGTDIQTLGSEFSADMRLRLPWRFAVDLQGDLFLPDFDPDRMVLEELSADLRFGLSRFAELSYLWELEDSRADGLGLIFTGGSRFRQTSSLTLRFFLSI
jgi:hypothetical protein